MIYYVEDDENIRNLVLYALEGKGIEARGFAAAPAFCAALDECVPDAILLDIMLPGEDGIALLRRLRSTSRTARIPVMMISAKGTEFDVVTGLDAGADDYLSKPFGIMELVSRVGALLRRVSEELPASQRLAKLVRGPVILYGSEHTVEVNGESVPLTLKEYELLHYLLQSPGHAFTREHLLETVWGWNYAGNSRTVDVHIQTLRQKLGEGADIIQTVRGVGYRCKR